MNHSQFFVRTKTSANELSTMAGSFLTCFKAEVKIKLPKLNITHHIFAPFHVTSHKSYYNVIYNRDLQQELGINLDFQNIFVGWKETKIQKVIN